MEQFPASRTVDAAPGGNRPAVVQLPVEGAAATFALPAVRLYRLPDAVGLHQLAQVGEILQIVHLADAKIIIYRLGDKFVTPFVLLVQQQRG